MIKRITTVLLCLAALLVIPGCSSILDGNVSSVTAHEKPTAAATDSVIEASTYDELKTQILGFVRLHEPTGIIRVNSYDGNLQADVNRACNEIVNDDPLGAYAVSKISGIATPIVSYDEVQITIDFNDVTKDQIDNIITVSTLRYLKSDLQTTLSGYAPSLTIVAKDIPLTSDDALNIIKQIYYSNPMDIVMLPITTPPKFYPDHGPDRIIVFTFGYRYEASTLTAMQEALKSKVEHIAESVTGNNDGAILLSLCQRLMSITDYDTATAESGDISDQNISATAYGALVTGSAVGEGYAMAFKALCDELGIECYVVTGTHIGVKHAWNIVMLEGNYYHIDVSMCDVNGIATAFLKNDTEMKKYYSWDTSSYKVCNGPITYASLTSSLATTSPSGSTAGSTANSNHTT